MRTQRTTVDYACGECGAKPGESCRFPSPIGVLGRNTQRLYHRDREKRFIRSVNRGLKT